MEVLSLADDLGERIANQMLQLILKSRRVPQRVRVRRPDLAQLLQPWLTGLGGAVECVARLDSAEEFRRGLAQFMGR
jgi:hypothetical protein